MNLPSPRLRLRRDVTACDTDGGMVLLDERTGRYWQLNSTGAQVLRALLDGATPEEVTGRLAETRAVAPDRVAADIGTLLGQLADAGLTEPGATR
ncbi:lasso peptide biosynthesis PqqD family chaperone [Streptomyces litchfieldiae]|uniref:Lasso peptide biosynthesis PqqD family chaperone n=1 Tax=Streptomyces litchfieldiae TaxID=3075543 RepID=A0ABU2MSD5_9ACTN|nr:lasso peptide biosynthesis PqqD family chaperone [Streptomyces sp. DSM 44938]MDT0344233.1 lasso peptide biosynthesis PqqD family chaperone [Streptomyces sp. DSM 44938]